MKRYVIALDQGTTSSRAILFDKQQRIVAMSQREIRQFYPQPGWVEQDAGEIFDTQYKVMMEAMAAAGAAPKDIAAIGITNQRETTVLWERDTGRPVYSAIGWQCRRTADICRAAEEAGMAPLIQDKTGLVIDAYFSATKVKWLLENIDGLKSRAERGEVLFGTVDSYLIYRLCGGLHVTDYTNASRTMLYNIGELEWDDSLLDYFGIPRAMLPRVVPSLGVVGQARIQGLDIPVAGIAGDQQSALFGHGCTRMGQAKNTYGTGCFLLMNTGERRYNSQSGLITTLAIGEGTKPHYALEGSIFSGGSVIQWLRDELGLIRAAEDSEYFAAKVPDNAGVYLVPAFTGLGAPYWDMSARGMLVGLSRGSGRNHIIRAALESIAYQTHDVLEAMTEDTGIPLSVLAVDGGATRNNLLMQFQADITGCPVERPELLETTALGAARLAGLGVGFWQPDDLAAAEGQGRRFIPHIPDEKRKVLLSGWRKAVKSCLMHSESDSGWL
jgi:glycerol kinase